jgi:hypothetical protein
VPYAPPTVPFNQSDWPNPVAARPCSYAIEAYSNPLTERSFKYVFRLPLVTKIERYTAQQPDPVPNLILSTLKPQPVPFFFNLNDDQPTPVWPKYVQQPDYMVNRLILVPGMTTYTLLRVPLVSRVERAPYPMPDQVINKLVTLVVQPMPIGLQMDFPNPVLPKVVPLEVYFWPTPGALAPVVIPPFVQSDYPNPVLSSDSMKGMDLTVVTYLPVTPLAQVQVTGFTAVATFGNPNSTIISGIWAEINPGKVPNWTPIKVS